VGSNLARVLGYQDFIHFNADLCDLNRIVMYCIYLSEINVKKIIFNVIERFAVVNYCKCSVLVYVFYKTATAPTAKTTGSVEVSGGDVMITIFGDF
jgi:hypothetical protein